MRRWWGLCLVALAIGCGEGGPPLDELPLRDALRAEPGVVAGLPAEARTRLAARLAAARIVDRTTDRLSDGTPAPEVVVGALDRLRLERQADALLVGIIADGLARPIADPPAADRVSPPSLPPIEGEPAGDTVSLEARALEGAAGASVRALLATSGAGHLWRVTGWPIGSIAIDGTVYVNGAWLAALAPDDGGAVDGGSDGPPPSGGGPTGLGGVTAPESPASSALGSGADASPASSGDPSPTDAGAEQALATKPVQIAEAASGSAGDGGVVIIIPPPTSPPPPPSNGPSVGDACGAGADACDSTDTSSCDGTDDGSDDSCGGNTDDGSDDSCTTPPDDGGGCQVARGGHHTRYGTVLWLMAPLGFLLGRRR
jgi:hypothetical protein